jgi:hypothetical protein
LAFLRCEIAPKIVHPIKSEQTFFEGSQVTARQFSTNYQNWSKDDSKTLQNLFQQVGWKFEYRSIIVHKREKFVQEAMKRQILI